MQSEGCLPDDPGVETLYDSLERAVEANPDSPSLGRRPIDAQGNAGEYEWITYKELQGKPTLPVLRLRTLHCMLRACERPLFWGSTAPSSCTWQAL